MNSKKNLLDLVFMVFIAFFLGVAPASAQTVPEGQSYIVQHDDTLWKIAEKYLGDGRRYGEIIAASQAKHGEDASYVLLQDPDLIVAGTKLWIPSADTAGETSLPTAPADTAAKPAAPQPAPAAATSSAPSGQIAFSFWNNSPARCTYEINVIDVPACLQDAASCQANRRIFALDNASEPALSPDGERLAFRGWGGIPEKHQEEALDHPYYGCSPQHPERQIGQTTLNGADYFRVSRFYEDSHPDWSPDGERILFDSARESDGRIRLMVAGAEYDIEEDLRLEGQHPSWAPDSDRFVYRGCDLTGNRCGLWLAKALPVQAWDAGLNLIGPLLEEPEAAHPDWSPTSDQIVYQSPVSGSWDLYLIDADGSNKQQLTSAPGIEGLPAWSPDGQWIAYLSDSEGGWGIWIINIASREAQLLFEFDGGIFSPLPVTPYFGRDWFDEQISWSK